MDEPTEPRIVTLSYNEKVSMSKIKEILHETLIDNLKGVNRYAEDQCEGLAQLLSDEIRGKLKKLGHERYKFVVHVFIGERREQGVRFALVIRLGSG
jgi:hypothetical protein